MSALPRRRLRLRILGDVAFPPSLPLDAVRSRFDFVETRPDAVVLQGLSHPNRAARVSLAPSITALDSRSPTIVFHDLDAWHWKSEWDETARRIARRANVLFGKQLPKGVGEDLGAIPLLFTCRDPVGTHPGDARLFFWGWFSERQHGRPDELPPDVWDDPSARWQDAGAEDRQEWLASVRYRGRLVRALRNAHPPLKLDIRNVNYWWSPTSERSLSERAFDAAITTAGVVFAPPGRGPNTLRHSEGWARKKLVLSENLAKATHLPEPHRWDAGEIVVLYSGVSDVVERCRASLHSSDYRDVREAGLQYYRRHGAAQGQLEIIEQALWNRL